MRIAVNLLPFRQQLAGAGHYTQNILRELVSADTTNEYIFFVAPRAAAHFAFDARNVTQVSVLLPDSTLVRIGYEQVVLPVQLAMHHIDLLLTPSVAIPILWRGKRVTVIYDMIAEHPQVTKYPPLRNAYVKWISRLAAQQSDALITISENSRREISQYARVRDEKIAIAPPATDLRRVVDEDTLARVRETYHLPERFVLYLGTLEPGKNLTRLVQAFARVKRQHLELEQHLVLAGAQGWGVREIENEIVKSDATGFHLIGFVEESDLAALYSLADLFVYPSLYEGFGMPPLEAMACGTPVIVSNISALPEVLGDLWTGKSAGLTVEPHDVDALAQAIARVLTDDTLRDKLRGLGLQRAREFSWTASAEIVGRVIASCGVGETLNVKRQTSNGIENW